MDSTSNVVADTICRTAELGLAITGAMDAGDFTFIEATATAFADTCNSCAMSGQFRDHAYRTLIDLPIVGFPPSYASACHAIAAPITTAQSSTSKHNWHVQIQARKSPTGTPAGYYNA